MLTNQILQSTVAGLKNITGREISVIEREGKVAASTENASIGTVIEGVSAFVNSPADSQSIQGHQYFKVLDSGSCEYVVAIKGEDGETYRIGKIAAFQVQGLLIAYKERYDKDNFIKNLLLDNLLLVDIYRRAKKLHIENGIRRIVYLIESDCETDTNAFDVVKNLFPDKSRDFVTSIDEKSIILVKELKEVDVDEDIEQIAKMIVETLQAEALRNSYVSIGTAITDLKSISNSYKEAKMALEVGKIFEEDKKIANYRKLGIGRLIYQLPLSLCKMFIDEVLQGVTTDQFDDETLVTANKFFENSLNVSETSRKLYIHRNTLVYRLDKLEKMTGIDLRNFENAIVFKITLMVSKYMKYRNKNLYK
ncbi:MAG: PucR family transcriptional regulator [Lachnospirales bacterium]